MGLDTPPEVIVGRYALYRKIASGGMATVYLARLLGPVGFSRTVAIKRLLPQFARDPEFVTMFLDEARLAARIRHPNIVPTLDVVATKGEAFLVMEYVQGESLAQLLRSTALQSERVPLRIAASILSGALLGLHAAHEARDGRGMPLNLVHRDVSPHNILVGTDGTARLLDFGVAKAEGRAQHLTREGHIKGKLGYMAPEQLSGDGVSRESDIYSAAVVLWETLVGRKVFAGTHDAIAYVRAQHPRIDPPSKYRPDITSEIDQIVLKGMRWDPADRFATAREMAAALERAVGAVSVLEVAEWLEVVAGQRIHLRAQELLAFERSSGAKIPVAQEQDLNTDQTVARAARELTTDDTTVPEAGRLPSAQASENPMPIELPTERTSAASPRARAARTWVRRARVVAGAAGIAALGLLSAVSVASVGSRARARAAKSAAATLPVAPGATSPGAQPSAASDLGGSSPSGMAALNAEPAGDAPLAMAPADVATAPEWPSAVAVPLMAADSPPAVPVTSLPVASAAGNSKPATSARKGASRSHALSKASAKPPPSSSSRPAAGNDAKSDAEAPTKPLSPFDAIGGRE